MKPGDGVDTGKLALSPQHPTGITQRNVHACGMETPGQPRAAVFASLKGAESPRAVKRPRFYRWEPGQVKTPIRKETVGRFDNNMFGDCQTLQPARRSLGWRRGTQRKGGRTPECMWRRQGESPQGAE